MMAVWLCYIQLKPYMQQSVGKNSIQGSGWVYIVFLGYQYIHLPSKKINLGVIRSRVNLTVSSLYCITLR